MIDTILTLTPLSSFSQPSFKSKKIYMAKDFILTALGLWTSLFRILYKECKLTHDLTQTWVYLYLCCINNRPAPLIRRSQWAYDLVQPLYKWKCKKGGLIIVSCLRVLVVLDHTVAVESPCWTILQHVLSDLLHLLHLCAWVEPWVA